jgi:spore photoproduct lyase
MIEKVTRKSMVIRPSGRSTDYISPSFGHGCLYNCSYCYMKRHKPEGLSIATNTEEILTAIDHHSWFADVEKPNQTHDKYITYDISCNEDFNLHLKYHDWKKIFKFFRDHPKAMGSFATKYVNRELYDFNPDGKIRVRYSLMPQKYADVLEPNTSKISDRIRNIPFLIARGYDVHINFSPVIVTEGWLDEYRKLFEDINLFCTLATWAESHVKAEVIFLTHNINKHFYNLDNGLKGEELLWKPEIQEGKISQYGGENLRYKHNLKAEYIKQWTELHNEIINWNKIRYIF